MSKNKELQQKVQRHVDELFKEVNGSQQLFELKEELTTNMKEKILDYESRGMEEGQAFKEAIISFGDLSGLVEDMRRHGQDKVKQQVYSSKAMRISNTGIVVGVLLILFGVFVSSMTYFMNLTANTVAGTGIFVVGGGALLTYSLLTRETRKKYAMTQVRALLYTLASALLLFGLFVAASSGFATGEIYVAISSLMIFCLAGVGLWLGLILTGSNRKKS